MSRMLPFRFDDHEIDQLDELVALLRSADERDGIMWHKQTRTRAVKVAIASLLVDMKNARIAMEQSRSKSRRK